MLATLAKAFLLPMLPEGFEMRCCEWDLWWFVPGGGVLDAEGALDETETVGFGPASEGAVLAETILTAAVSCFVLKTVAVLPLLRLLLRMGALGLGPDILTVVVMRVVRPPGEGVDDDDEVVVPAESAFACAACVARPAPEIDAAAAAVPGLGLEQTPPAVSAACAAK